MTPTNIAFFLLCNFAVSLFVVEEGLNTQAYRISSYHIIYHQQSADNVASSKHCRFFSLVVHTFFFMFSVFQFLLTFLSDTKTVHNIFGVTVSCFICHCDLISYVNLKSPFNNFRSVSCCSTTHKAPYLIMLAKLWYRHAIELWFLSCSLITINPMLLQELPINAAKAASEMQFFMEGNHFYCVSICQWAMSRLNPQAQSNERLSIIDPPVSRRRHVCMCACFILWTETVHWGQVCYQWSAWRCRKGERYSLTFKPRGHEYYI